MAPARARRQRRSAGSLQAIESGHREYAPKAAFGLGVLLEAQRDAAGAGAAYQQAIDSGHWEWWAKAATNLGILLVEHRDSRALNLAILLKSKGYLKEARAVYERAIASDHPEHAAKAALNLGVLLKEQAMAANPDAPIDVLLKLAPSYPMALLAEGGSWARTLAARHPNTPAVVLAQLASDEAIAVRRSVAHNPATPASTLHQLTGDPAPAVRLSLAANPAAPPVVETLARDVHREVRAALARRPDLPATLLALLARDAAWQVRRLVAQHPGAVPELLETLALDSERSVCYAAARHPRLPQPVRDLLAGAEDPVLRQIVARPPTERSPAATQRTGSAPRDAQSAPAWDAEHEAARPIPGPGVPLETAPEREEHLHRALIILATSSWRIWRAVGIAHPATLHGAGQPGGSGWHDSGWDPLPARLASADWLDRYALARNPALPSGCLATLAQDSNRVVRAAARAALGARSEEET